MLVSRIAEGKLRFDMDSVIREGALRLLTNEGSSDVILSCQGHRVTAHKVILSMASPMFRVLLKDSTSEPTVIIFPDVSSNTMSLILDYIYTGSVLVYSNSIQDFLSLAKLLSIQLHFDKSATVLDKKDIRHTTKIEDDVKKTETIENAVSSTRDDTIYSKSNLKKLPKLVPLRSLRGRKERRWCSYLLPSPWCPRSEGVYGDPRKVEGEERRGHMSAKSPGNDPNNNSQCPATYIRSNHPDDYSLVRGSGLEPYKVTNYHNVPSNRDLCEFKDIPQPFNVDNLSKSSGVSRCRDRIEDPSGFPDPSVCTEKEIPARRDFDEETIERSRLSVGELTDRCYDKEEGGDDVTELDKKYDKQKPFRCEECGKGFSQLRNYKYHRSVHEGTKEFAAKCPECGKVFNDKGYLSSHMKIHRDKKEYGCPHCPKRFNQRVAYNMHLRIHTGVKPHECSTCGKSFSRKMLLKQHQRVHTGERPYSCPECGKTFADRSNMSLHARLHTGVKPYGCSLCPKTFTKKHHLKTHMNFHTGLKPYECPKCGLSFSQSSNMRTHHKKCAGKSLNRDEMVDGGRGDANLVGQAAV
ncbi:unnamed protein product [Phaedon cochleariae]|uniref:Uncharacterized protein n=1 Tax=Phaedon cochleariae TaxID=80249 RepID=A0A9P0DDS0_PHACE|nr:unnamed protein product [Phaedon cochleariae]